MDVRVLKKFRQLYSYQFRGGVVEFTDIKQRKTTLFFASWPCILYYINKHRGIYSALKYEKRIIKRRGFDEYAKEAYGT